MLAALPGDVAATVHAYVTITMVQWWPLFLTFELADDLLSIHVEAGKVAHAEITPFGRRFQCALGSVLNDDNPVMLVTRILDAWGLNGSPETTDG
jgi:hypothetical protein